jgi:hypothetical protein
MKKIIGSIWCRITKRHIYSPWVFYGYGMMQFQQVSFLKRECKRCGYEEHKNEPFTLKNMKDASEETRKGMRKFQVKFK